MSENNVIPENLVLDSGSFLKLLETLVNTFGSAGESMVFRMGFDNGQIFCRNVLKEEEPDGKSLNIIFNMVLKHASKVGWANMVVEDFNPQNGSIKVVLQDNAFKNYCLKVNLPQCFFLRGYLSGIIKELTNVDYVFSHSECYSHGDDHCSIRMVTKRQ